MCNVQQLTAPATLACCCACLLAQHPSCCLSGGAVARRYVGAAFSTVFELANYVNYLILLCEFVSDRLSVG